ncbi:MAG: aminotransferase class I/II-fold pyridoxal phosphate-dependent enzyme [Flavobacteriales bacterium]
MSFQISNYVRPSVLSLKPYASARHEFTGEADIFLDANENSLGSPLNEGLHRYPDPYQTELRNMLAELKGVLPNQIFFGNGSDEPIDLLMRAFCRPGIDHILVQPPTYSMYGISAAINDVEVVQVPLQADFQPDRKILLKSINTNTKMVFFCSPNNPSGNLMKREVIEEVLRMQNCMVVVDEAYIDFAEEPSLVHELIKYPNLVVLQTFSKALGLAAARLGVLFADEAIIKVLNKIKPPYNISLLSQQAGIKSFAG